MAKFIIEKETEDGWSRWVPPVMVGYRMSCCDCNLVHDMEFQVVRASSSDANGFFQHEEPLDPNEYRVLFRAKRNNRSTSALRRSSSKKQL
jgi:hypothetical protein